MAWPPSFPRRDLALPLLALALATGCAGVRQGPARSPGTPRGAWYVVEPGDTLTAIATRHGVIAEDLAEINGLRRDDHVSPGQRIFLLEGDARRAARRPGPAPGAVTVVIPRRAPAGPRAGLARAAGAGPPPSPVRAPP